MYNSLKVVDIKFSKECDLITVKPFPCSCYSWVLSVCVQDLNETPTFLLSGKSFNNRVVFGHSVLRRTFNVRDGDKSDFRNLHELKKLCFGLSTGMFPLSVT